MPALLLPLLIAAAPAGQRMETVSTGTLLDATIREWGTMPSFGSGVFWMVRRLVVVTANGEMRTLYRTHFSADKDTPPPGSRCEISFKHLKGISAMRGEGDTIVEGDIFEKMTCRAP
jgi:hypothetical protein